MFRAAKTWLQLAIDHILEQARTAAQALIKTIPRLAWLGSALPYRHKRVQEAGYAARDAAAVSLSNGEHETALEWLEQGLSVVWSQLLQLRSPSDELELKHPKLSSKMRLLSTQLAGLTQQETESTPSSVDYHQAAYEHDQLLNEIRLKPGFEQFLLPKTHRQLRAAAKRGPVVMLIASRLRCDALILLSETATVLQVTLKDLTLERAQYFRKILQECRSKTMINFELPRLGILFHSQQHDNAPPTIDREVVIIEILKDLWQHVVHPVLEVMAITTPMEAGIRRVWWCPTGPLAFLPIHAAGIYSETNGPKLVDYVVSSYTPTLGTLLRHTTDNTNSAKPQLLTVALPSESSLPGTRREVEAIEKHAKEAGINVLSLVEEGATVSNVAQGMKEFNWAHFACHGKQNASHPNESSLLLSGGSRLPISEVIKLSLDNPELAFLSACETATGDQKLEDEAVHIAAGMLLAGYRAVIGTMWKIDDSFAADVAIKTYELLFKTYGADASRAAEALHFAIKTVREEREAKGREVPFFHWVPFMHMGI